MTNSKLSKSVNITLWTLQWTLSALLLSGAVMKLMPIEHVAPVMPWMGQVPEYMVRGVALVDLADGLGIVLPALLKRNKHLTLFAAAGIFLLMVCAVVFHVLRGEEEAVGINIFTAAVSVLIGFGRWYELRAAGKLRLKIC